MNILFLSTETPYPPDHGHYLRTYNILKYIARNNNVYFLSFIKKGGDIKFIEPIRKICTTADAYILPDNTSRPRLLLSLLANIFSSLPYIAQKYYQQCMRDKIREVLREHKIDIVHFDMLHMARYRMDVDRIPAILTEHNVEFLRLLSLLRNSKNIVFKAFMYLQFIKLKKFEKRVCSDFDICATVSEDDRRTLQMINPSARFAVIPNGVDSSYFVPDESKVIPKSLVWVGGMNDIYNKEAVDYFLDDVLPLIQQEIPDVTFVAVGKSPTKKLLHLAVKDSNVKAVGYVSDIRPYVNAAAVCVAPLRSGGGTKLKVLNALSMAKAVVTTSIGAEGIDVDDNKHLMIANDRLSFAEKTVYLLKNPDFASNIGQNGRKIILEKYDWEIIGGIMDRLYREVLAQKDK